MSYLTKKITSINEDYPGEKWLSFYQKVSWGYRQWFLQNDSHTHPELSECKEALEYYMPEFVPLWEHLIRLADADEIMANMLSLYSPASYKRGCSQAVWTRYSPILVRNYDYSPSLFEGRIVKSKWFNTQVICTTDCLWGALDGMNEHGLSVSLAYGGNDVMGKGFGVTLVVRYVLEFCKNTLEAIEVLKKIPVNMAYNITLIDAWNHVATVQLSPIEKPNVTSSPFAVNQQGKFDLSTYSIFSNSSEREQVLSEILFDPLVSIESFVAAFAYEPLFTTDYKNNFGTLYTAIYNSFLRACEFRFPGQIKIYQSFDNFIDHDILVSY
jgi:predicted choloylglycine hydrolase